MVYCTKCGTKNAEVAEYCVKCGAKLGVSQEETWDKRMEKWGEEFGKRAEEWGEDFGKRTEKECFGLPHGGLILGLFIGVIVILVGVTSLLTGSGVIENFWPLFWPLIIIVFGLLIAAGALYSLTRRR